MLKIYTCLATEHDLRFVAVAALLCLLSTSTALSLVERISNTAGWRRLAWLAVSSTVSGVGIWSTHFVALLGYAPHLETGYDLRETLGSLAIAILLFAAAYRLAAGGAPWARIVGGAIAGLGVWVMHYLGMAAFRTEGVAVWDLPTVVATLVFGVGLGAFSFRFARTKAGRMRRLQTVLLFALTVCGVHFAGMSALTIYPDGITAVPAKAVPEGPLAVAVACAAAGLLLLSVAAVLAGRQQRRAETARLGDLANAAIEGLAVCDNGRIVTANESLARMTDLPVHDLVGVAFDSLLAAGGAETVLQPGVRLEAELRGAGGGLVPVELIAHEISFGGRRRLVIAVRDLRDRIAAEAKIRFLAHHDPLTDLPNRQSFADRLDLELQVRRRKDDQFAVLCLDLDRFKQVNDVLGHGAGDVVLRTVSRRILSVLEPTDVLARLGGDEFAILRLGACQPAALADLCQAILEAVEPEIDVDGQAASVGVSLGVALFPQDGRDAATLMRNADAAL